MRKARWIFDYASHTIMLIAGVCAALLSTVLAAGLVAGTIDYYLTVDPTPETKSEFFKSYSDKDILDMFDAKQGSFSQNGESSNAHHGFATHSRTLRTVLHVKDEKRAGIQPTILWTIEEELKSYQAQVSSKTVDADGTIEIKYVIGPTDGLVKIPPPRYSHEIHYRSPRVAAMREPENTVEVSIEETWYKSRKEKGPA